ncbi:MAG: type II toxin-antitoxin system VapC family toxin [Leptolyngbyaceae cyanobacterium RM2_2_4]|nr:type II toxin-antitoxin system VapC family toxin [Leptolyngbyaceae cyanobacterium SM1_4_3]NJN89945.1 type II toxin-antitoxin system VapC family toxin [Leptolyngbyaceae cyanobacterium SL_5_14]NJO53246.1 type II toxin-antitoxin system VapC family toxin [Leptolyngbyaceae cyanobacterium RM2_2_4]NJO66537.1 type II toxin-antitoxin system VapC family toxin [Leptolyngbyaceae cyanobacterium RM1_405_57]
MRILFADTFYWVALINPRDDWYDRVFKVSSLLEQVQIVTTEEVLIEVLTFYAEAGIQMRQRTIAFVDSILSNATTQVIEQSHESFLSGLKLYRQRLDKGYSLTDCISMNTMEEFNILEVLTHDQHFVQEGFTVLFR